MDRYLEEILQDPRTNSKQGGRIQSRMPERQKSELFKEVENIKKDIIEMKEMMKGKFINNHFVEEDVIVDLKYMNAGAGRMILIDSGAPESVEGYLKDMKIDEDEINKKSCYRRFRIGETTYLSDIEI